MERYPTVFLISILLCVIFIPSPAYGLAGSPEAAAIIGAIGLSMLTVPLYIGAFFWAFFANWPKTRRWLQGFAVLPGVMAIYTWHLIVIQGNNRVDLLFIPLIHFGLMIVMIVLGRLDRYMESKNDET